MTGNINPATGKRFKRKALTAPIVNLIVLAAREKQPWGYWASFCRTHQITHNQLCYQLKKLGLTTQRPVRT